MTASLRAMLAGVVDYAGLFPPARLELEPAFRNYVRYRRGPEAWMLGRFVCPATRLSELDRFHEELANGGPFAVSVIGRGGESVPDWAGGLRADFEAMAAFRARHGRVATDVLEVKLPAAVGNDAFPELLAEAGRMIDAAGAPPLAMFVEAGSGGDWRGRLAAVVAALADRNRAATAHRARSLAGLKVRCGGPAPGAVPSAEQVAFAIASCRDASVPLKATAGLHHPIRHVDPELAVKVHGFLNVFGAGVLAHARRLPEIELRNIVADERPQDFDFSEEVFRWREVAATPAEIAAARHDLATSFGSCSFDEPRDDLRRLGLI